eukprot:1192370-Prorocentrum_minimum.AAC.4
MGTIVVRQTSSTQADFFSLAMGPSPPPPLSRCRASFKGEPPSPPLASRLWCASGGCRFVQVGGRECKQGAGRPLRYRKGEVQQDRT